MLDALLCHMPFGLVLQPSPALGVLQAVAGRANARVESRYFSLDFARIIGLEAYEEIAHRMVRFGIHEVGQWLFASALFPDDDLRPDEYVRSVLRSATPPVRPFPVAPTLVDIVLDARSRVEGFLDLAVDEVVDRAPRVVGFTCGPHQRIPSLALARRIKRLSPETFIVFGGADVIGPMGLAVVRRFRFVDAVVSGPGDIVFPQILAHLSAGQPVSALPGVLTAASPTGSEVDGRTPVWAPEPPMDELPLPYHDDYFAQLEARSPDLRGIVFVPVETTRGCSWSARGRQCLFCSENAPRRPVQSMSASRAIAELDHVDSAYRPSWIRLVDRTLDPGCFAELVPSLAGRARGRPRFLSARPTLTREQLSALRAAGAEQISFGIETLSSSILRAMRKGFTALHGIQVLKWASETGIAVAWNLLTGIPGEREEDYREMARLIPRLTHLSPPSWEVQVAMMRFSPLYDEAGALGLTDVSPAEVYGFLYPFDREALAELAFYFSYRDGHPVDGKAVATVRAAVAGWREARARGARLVASDHDGKAVITDTRPGAPQEAAVVTGLERDVLRACDRFRTAAQLAEQWRRDRLDPPGLAAIEGALRSLDARWLVASDGPRWLSLTVPAEADGPTHHASNLGATRTTCARTSTDALGRGRAPARVAKSTPRR